MTDSTDTHYEVTFRHAERSGRIRERFPFDEGRDGKARASAYARAQELAEAGARQVTLDLVTRKRVNLPL